ncbi:acetyltransferase YpeA [Deinococcus carri]|uniref:Acetyltransferase YpeA n=1 Tax=Deinococcus carri TaxID=1211323 RepID=A0ABP9WC99_9DEIO
MRPATAADAPFAALLHNGTQEPHYHRTGAQFAAAFARNPGGYVLAETGGQPGGLGTFRLPDFHPTHAWLGLHLHPDHRADGTTAALLAHLAAQARAAGRFRLWTSVREDYLPTWPDLPALGFREVHRTFGGGFHLKGWSADPARLEADLAARAYTLEPAAPYRDDPRLHALYTLTRGDKISAPPTIPPAAETLIDEDALWDAAFLARQAGEVVGLALPERSRLNAWNAVLVVHPDHRRQGIATALLARVARQLQAQGLGFLNVAGSGRDTAYLGVLRRLGANIEPDWLAWEREA